MITTVTSARTAITQAYSIEMQGSSDFTGAAGPSMTTSTHRIANRYEAGKIISAVEAQAAGIKAWLLWAYGPAFFAVQRSVQECAVDQVHAMLDIDFNDMAPQVGLRAQLLVYAYMDNYRAMAFTGNRKYRKPAHFDHAVRRISGGQVGFNLNGRNFARDYGYLGELVEGVCGKLDSQGLPPVGVALASIRQFRDPTEVGMAPIHRIAAGCGSAVNAG